MKKPRAVIFLLIWFIWSSGRDIDVLVRYSVSSDYYVFSSSGLVPLFFILAFSSFLLNTSAVYFIFKPLPQGYYYALAAPLASAVQSIVTILLAIPNMSGVREAYAIGRELRGLAVREKALDKIFTVEAMSISLVIVLIIYVAVVIALLKNKAYFCSSPEEKASQIPSAD